MAHPHDLIRFLRARYDEEERIARAATPGPWEQTPERVGFLASAEYWDVVDCSGTPTARENAEHVAIHDPARVLREVVAKRVVLDAWDDIDYEMPWSVYDALAAVYAGHPDYPRW